MTLSKGLTIFDFARSKTNEEREIKASRQLGSMQPLYSLWTGNIGVTWERFSVPACAALCHEHLARR